MILHGFPCKITDRRTGGLRGGLQLGEHLPVADDEFGAAISFVGIVFAPHHELAAAELTRVVRPGGRLTLLNWTPEGFIGRMFSTLKPFAPPPPPGARPAPRWAGTR